VLLNLAGGEAVQDLEVLEQDAGFCAIHRQVERYGVRRKERQQLQVVQGAANLQPRLRVRYGAIEQRVHVGAAGQQQAAHAVHEAFGGAVILGSKEVDLGPQRLQHLGVGAGVAQAGGGDGDGYHNPLIVPDSATEI